MSKYSKYSDTIISEMKEFYSAPARDLLKKAGINTLEELLLKSDDKSFKDMFKYTCRVYEEVIASTKLLRYKLLREDPCIPIENLKNLTLKKDLGFSTASANHALRSRDKDGHFVLRTDEEVINQLLIMSKQGMFDKSYFQSNWNKAGETGIAEIINKATIFSEYYESKLKSISNQDGKDICVTEEDDLDSLFQKLKFLAARSRAIGEQIELVERIIEQKINDKGISKCVGKK